jgi:hypothetical protein
MPLKLDDPELRRISASLDHAGYRYSDQYDARLRWLELEYAQMRRRLEYLTRAVEEHVTKDPPGGRDPQLRLLQDGD